MQTVVLYRHRHGFEYDLDWRDALTEQPEWEATAIPLAPTVSVVRSLLRAERVVLLPSVDPAYPGRFNRILERLLACRRGRLAYLPRNEYKDFRRKRRFIRRAGVDLTASRLPLETAEYLYADLSPTIELPHAVNPRVFHPPASPGDRPVDLGSRTARYPPIVLDSDRNDIEALVQAIREREPKWTIDYSSHPEDRFDRNGWAAFLRSCRLTISTEAGAAFVDREDRVQHLVERRLAQDPELSLEALWAEATPLTACLPSGKHITSRHFEAAGCATGQILVEGSYNGILTPGEHYLSLRPDGSNFEAVLGFANEPTEVTKMARRARELLVGHHTYAHRATRLRKALN